MPRTGPLRDRTPQNPKPKQRRRSTARQETDAEIRADRPSANREASAREAFNGMSFQDHADVLGDNGLSQPMYQQRRARIIQRLQQSHGNRYIQKLVQHIRSSGGKVAWSDVAVDAAGAERERESGQSEATVPGNSTSVQPLGSDQRLQASQENTLRESIDLGANVQVGLQHRSTVRRDEVAVAEEAEPATRKKSGGVFARIGKALKKGAAEVGGAVLMGAEALGGVASSAASAIVETAKAAPGAVADAARQVSDALVAAATATGRAAKAASDRVVSAAKTLAGAMYIVAAKAGGAALEGAKVAGGLIVDAASYVVGKLKSIGKAIYTADFADLDATQYRVTTNRKVEKVVRIEDADGKPVYLAVAEVVSFEGNRPVLNEYPEPVNLGDWYPKVTHINGMAVKPESGLKSAERLYQAVNDALPSGEFALETDVLYTYSAHRGMVTDALECIKGKLYIGDDATRVQEQIILDAVRNENRTTVSAHSRGTIKTDNAVRNAFAVLKQEFLQDALADDGIKDQATQAANKWVADMEQHLEVDAAGLDLSIFIDVYVNEYAKQVAGPRASAAMDEYIQLIYAGNAVQFPSGLLEGALVVAEKDPVSGVFGKYFKGAAKWFGSRMDMTRVKGGHGFVDNYSQKVGEMIAKDLIDRAEEIGA